MTNSLHLRAWRVEETLINIESNSWLEAISRIRSVFLPDFRPTHSRRLEAVCPVQFDHDGTAALWLRIKPFE